MSKVTLQTIFNKVVKGLAKQGFERAMIVDTCVYLALDGKRCAIGHLMSKPKAAQAPMGSYRYSSEVRACLPKSVTNILGGANAGTLGDQLQQTHDQAANPEEVKHNLVVFAQNNNLKLPKELK